MERDTEFSELAALRGKTGWSANGILTTGQTTVPVSMQCDLKPDNYTVQVQSTQPSGVGGGAQTNVIVTWSVAGTPVIREFSAPGSITGVGEAVRVQIFDATDVKNYPSFTAGLKYPVSASVAKGTRGTTMTPPMLIPGASGQGGSVDFGPGMYALASNTLLNIPIPQGVGIISVMVNAVDLANGTVVTNANAQIVMGNSGFGIEVGAAPVNLGTWVPVPPGATILGMRNVSANRLWFSVAFGIDG